MSTKWWMKPQEPLLLTWSRLCEDLPVLFAGNGPHIGPLTCSRWRQHRADPAGHLSTEVSEWKLLLPNPAWESRVIIPFLPGPGEYHQVFQCLCFMLLLMRVWQDSKRWKCYECLGLGKSGRKETGSLNVNPRHGIDVIWLWNGGGAVESWRSFLVK